MGVARTRKPVQPPIAPFMKPPPWLAGLFAFDAESALCYLDKGQFNVRHSSVAQWQSIRLLTEGL
jgi:hypothetical protein